MRFYSLLFLFITYLYFSCALREANAIDITSQLEFVGNPTSIINSIKQICAPDTSQPYSRNPWDLQTFDNKIYIGSGNSSNAQGGQARNAGPVKICKYDPVTHIFSFDTITHLNTTRSPDPNLLYEEQIDVFRVIDNELYIPGNDPAGAEQLQYYRRTIGSNVWVPTRVGGGHHLYDVMKFNNKIFLAMGSIDYFRYGPNGTSPWYNNPTFTYTRVNTVNRVTKLYFNSTCCSRTWHLFELNDRLYVSTHYGPPVLRFKEPILTSGTNPQALEIIKGNVFFPDSPPLVGPNVNGDVHEDMLLLGIRKSVHFDGRFIYIAGKNIDDHQWLPHGLYVARSETDVNKINLGTNIEPWDLLVHNNEVYVLTATVDPIAPTPTAGQNQYNPYKKYTKVTVFKSSDLINWTEFVSFPVDPNNVNTRPFIRSFARSFEIVGNDMYFGIGTTLYPISLDSGNIVRVKNAFTTSITPSPSPKPGDTNSDGNINLVDLSTLLSNFGKNNQIWNNGDFNADGLVNLTDLSTLLADFGR